MHLTKELAVQLIGFGAMGLAIISFQAKKRTSILIFQLLSNALWTVQFIFLGGITGAALNALGAVRAYVYSLKEKHKWAGSIAVPIVFCLLFVVSGLLTYEGPQSFLPMLGMILSSFVYYINDEQKIRLLALSVSPPWLIYDILSGSVAGVFNEIFTVSSIIIAFIRYKKNRNEAPTA